MKQKYFETFHWTKIINNKEYDFLALFRIESFFNAIDKLFPSLNEIQLN